MHRPCLRSPPLRVVRRLFGIALLLLGVESFAATFPLRVSPNHRYLEDATGQPFLVVGDAAWSLIAQLNLKDQKRYLDDRARRGFNAIIVNLIEHKFASHAPAALDGTHPFLHPGDFAHPNPVYFEFAHRAVEQAWRRGISVWLFPAYLGWKGGDEGEHNSRPPQIRRQAWWAVLCGASGQFFGNNPIWHFDGPTLFPNTNTWPEALHSTGSRDMERLAHFFRKQPWSRLVPLGKDRLVADGGGTETRRILAAQTPDHRVAILYIPSDGNQPRQLTLNLQGLRPPVALHWFNPAGKTKPGKSSRSLDAPGLAKSAPRETTAREPMIGSWCW